MTTPRRASRSFALLSVGMAFAIALQTGCGSVAICARDVSAPVSASCVDDRIRKGEQVSVRTDDGVTHNGHFIRLDAVGDSTNLVMSEFEPRSGRAPFTVAFNLANIDSVSMERSVPPPLAKAAGFTALLALVAFVALAASLRGLGGLN